MANEFGLPGLRALDSPFGLRDRNINRPQPLRPVLLPDVPNPIAPVINTIQQFTGAPAQLASNVTPFRATNPITTSTQAGDFPVVGKNVSLDQFVNLQRKAESSGNYQALNREKVGNTASGAYQYTDRTWNNYGGYPKAMLAPPEIQDRKFAEDLQNRVRKYNGDLFKAAAEHYLPVQANNPAAWDSPAIIRIGKRVVSVKPVRDYLASVFKGTPYAAQLEEYINAHK